MDSVAGKWSPKDSQVAGSQGADGVGVGAAHPGRRWPPFGDTSGVPGGCGGAVSGERTSSAAASSSAVISSSIAFRSSESVVTWVIRCMWGGAVASAAVPIKAIPAVLTPGQY